MTFVLRDLEWPDGEAFFWPWQQCFGNPPMRFSRSCRNDSATWWDWYRMAEHGMTYCVPASASMIASAYGKCLSQDRIAYQIRSSSSIPWDDLGHGRGANCGDGGLCDDAVLFAMGMLPKDVGGYDLDFIEKISRSTADIADPFDFGSIRDWIKEQRPVMIANENHASVIAGYCADVADDGSEEQWFFIYDPIAGPILVDAKSVLENTAHLWAFPSVTNQQFASRFVAGDENGLWNDWDEDGIVDFDEALRFATSPFCGVTAPDGTSDLVALQADSQTALQQKIETGEYPPINWIPWDPWMWCPGPY